MNRFELSPCLILAAACAWGQTANPEFAFREQRVRTGGDAQGVCALDADRDGDLDLFVYRASTEANQLFLNDGQGGFHEASDRLPSLRDRALDACVGDFDRDGDLDLAVVSRGGGLLRPFWRLLDRRARPEPYLLRNDGSGRFSFVPDALPWRGSPDCGRPTGVASADLDRDGDLDLVLSGPRGALVLRNDGSGRFTREALPGEGAPAVASGDYDGDRGADVLLARTFDAALSFPQRALARQLGTGVGAVRDVACADLEGDQRDEVAYAGSSGSVVWLDGGQRRIDLPLRASSAPPAADRPGAACSCSAWSARRGSATGTACSRCGGTAPRSANGTCPAPGASPCAGSAATSTATAGSTWPWSPAAAAR